MNFLDKLDLLMEQEGLNKRTLSQRCGVPYMTISDFYKKGYENTRISTVRKLANYFDVTLDYLICDEIIDPHFGKENVSVPDKNTTDVRLHRIVECYDGMDDVGKDSLTEQAEFLLSRHPKCKSASDTA